MSRAYYNEIDPYAAQWIRNLIAAGHIADGDVDERSIVDVQPADLAGYTQCHFFAGIAGWSHALRLAGWPDDRPVWTGSCPCQPFSAAGKGGGFDDARHLWPEWFRLIGERRPGVVFGEQVASPAGLMWLDLVQSDMEAAGYAFAAVDCCSAGVGAPHIRQRLGFVGERLADQSSERLPAGTRESGVRHGTRESERSIDSSELADADDAGSQGRAGMPERADQRPVGPGGVACWPADADGGNAGTEGIQRSGQHGLGPQDAGAGDVRRLGQSDRAGSQPRDEAAEADRYGRSAIATGGGTATSPLHGFWRDADWLLCRDGKWRPIRPGLQPLAHGVPARVGKLRAAGNAINPHQFAEIIRAYDDVTRSTDA